MQYAWAAYRSTPSKQTIAPVTASCSGVITFDNLKAAPDGSLAFLPIGFEHMDWGTFTVANSTAIADAYALLVAERAAPVTETDVAPHQLIATGYVPGISQKGRHN